MATRVAAVVEMTGIEEMERQFVELVEQVEWEKEKTRDTFQQLHSLLVVREGALLSELDGVVVEVRQVLKEKREVLHELQEAKESAEQKLTKNKLKDVLEKNLRNLEDNIREELSKPLNVTWVEVEWKREQLEQSIVELSKVIRKKELPFRTEDYSLKKDPIWYHEGTDSSVFEDPYQLATDSCFFKYPQQLAIHTKSGNIFVADFGTSKLQVFDNTGNYLYHIPTPPFPIEVCLSDEFIFVTADELKLIKIRISNKETIKSVETEKHVCGMDISNNIYVCESGNNSVSVFDKNLNFLNRIPLKSPHFTSDTRTLNIRLHKNEMYVMFGGSDYWLQVFSQDGQLIRGVIPYDRTNSMGGCFFSLDRLGNIIVSCPRFQQIRIYSNSGHLIRFITYDMEDQGLYYPPGSEHEEIFSPMGIAVDKQNNIVVANRDKKYLIAF